MYTLLKWTDLVYNVSNIWNQNKYAVFTDYNMLIGHKIAYIII